MKALVTGATGFIGSQLVERLVEEGHGVRALARPGSDASGLERIGVEVVRGDIRNLDDVQRAVDDCPLVFHLAKSAGGPIPGTSSPVSTTGTENVALASLRAGVARLVYASSTTVYGTVRNRAITESTPIRPVSHAAKSKADCEDLLLARYRNDGLPSVVARVSSVFGPGCSSWRGFFEAIAAGEFRLVGSGDNFHQPGDVSDIAEGLLRCGTAPNVEGRVYILTGNEPISLRDMVRLIDEECGVTTARAALPHACLRAYGVLNSLAFGFGGIELPRMDSIRVFLNDRIFDLSRAKADLGYVPKVSVKETIRRTLESFRNRRAS